MSCISELTRELVDYAGLFPPASLPLESVVANYAVYLSEDPAMLARIIIPAKRLSEFSDLARPHLPTDAGGGGWRISSLVSPVESGDYGRDLELIEQFNEHHANPKNGLAVVDAVEIKAPTQDQIEQTAGGLPAGLTAFLEIPHASDPTMLIESIANCDARATLRAKIRTGGITEDLIPSSQQVAMFLVACASSDVGLKATAGLHHPIRGEYRLTYKDGSDCGVMHGFLNMVVAAAFAFLGKADVELIEGVLNETDSRTFRFGANRIDYVNESIQFDDRQLVEFRNAKFVSFGSCSYTEPTAELLEIS